MTTSRIVACSIGIAALLAAILVRPAEAEEKLVGTYSEVRTALAFKVRSAAVQKLLPDGWEVAPVAAGPSKDANLNIILIDRISVTNPDGKPRETDRYAAPSIPARKKGTDQSVSMVFGGISSAADLVPGPYGNATLAKVTVDRHLHTDTAGVSTAEEEWQYIGNDGDRIELQLKYVRGVSVRIELESRPHSAIKPEFYRIYRLDLASDVVRSVATGVDHVQSVIFKSLGSDAVATLRRL
jgi:hypothetical protein